MLRTELGSDLLLPIVMWFRASYLISLNLNLPHVTSWRHYRDSKKQSIEGLRVPGTHSISVSSPNLLSFLGLGYFLAIKTRTRLIRFTICPAPALDALHEVGLNHHLLIPWDLGTVMHKRVKQSNPFVWCFRFSEQIEKQISTKYRMWPEVVSARAKQEGARRHYFR